METKCDLTQDFIKNLTAVKGEYAEDFSTFLDSIESGNILVESQEKTPKTVLEVLKTKNFEILFADELFQTDSYKNVVFNNTVLGITFPFLAIADTGTVIESTECNRMRSISLLPSVHLSVITEDKIVKNMAEAINLIQKHFTDEKNQLQLPGVLTFITGPSRTADIEQTLTVGVHGPIRKAVHIL